MSDTNNDTSDIKKAAENVDPQQIEKNLEEDKQTKRPKPLTDNQKTSFIDQSVSTDK